MSDDVEPLDIDWLPGVYWLLIGVGVTVYNFASVMTRPDADVPGNWTWFAIGGVATLLSTIYLIMCLVASRRDRRNHDTGDDER